MARPATLLLLCLLAAAASAQAREPGVRVLYWAPAGPPSAIPWALRPVLSAPTPLLAVSDRGTMDGGTTVDFFARLADLGFACLAFEPPRRRIRRVEVVRVRPNGEEWFGYAGGRPKVGAVFIVDPSGRAAGGRWGFWTARGWASMSAGCWTARSRRRGS